MSEWKPSAKTLLTLKQLGFSRSVISAALENYVRAAADPNDREFLKDVRLSAEIDDDHYDQLVDAAQIPVYWKPENCLYERLEKEGYSAAAIEQYRNMFILLCRDRGVIPVKPTAVFRQFCLRRPKRLPSPLSYDWMPGKRVLQEIFDNICPDKNYVLDKIASFIGFNREREHHDWEQQFKSFIANSVNTKRP